MNGTNGKSFRLRLGAKLQAGYLEGLGITRSTGTVEAIRHFVRKPRRTASKKVGGL